jgi:hypothetical protein
MSNHHLRNADLSLKAKGLLSQMLSLPEDWDYTLQGLSYINREKIDAIRTAVWELEKAGYIVRRQVRDEKGKMAAIEYIIYEQPRGGQEPSPAPPPDKPSSDSPTLDNPTLENPTSENPTSENPTSENPTSDFPTSGNPTQLNKDIQNKEKLNTDLSITESNPIRSPRGAAQMSAVDAYREVIRANIEYPFLTERHDPSAVDEIVDLMLETVCTARKTIRVAGDDYPAELVKAKLLRLKGDHIDYVFDCMRATATEIRNIKKYLLAALFNAPSTIDSYYTALVAHDMASGLI